MKRTSFDIEKFINFKLREHNLTRKSLHQLFIIGNKDFLGLIFSPEVRKYLSFRYDRVLNKTFYPIAIYKKPDISEKDVIKETVYSFESRLRKRLNYSDNPFLRAGFLLEFYALNKMYAELCVEEVNIKHTIPKVYQQYFGNTTGSNRTIRTKVSKQDMPSYRDSFDMEFKLSNPIIFSNTVESIFARLEGRYGSVLVDFLLRDEQTKSRNEEYRLNFENIADSLNKYENRIKLAFFIAGLGLKTEPLVLKEEDSSIPEYIDLSAGKTILSRSINLMQRNWTFIVLPEDSETEFAFNRSPIVNLTSKNTGTLKGDLFIPLSRTLALYIGSVRKNRSEGIGDTSIVLNGVDFINKKKLLSARDFSIKKDLDYFHHPSAKDIYYI